jgi:hypothetical protein
VEQGDAGEDTGEQDEFDRRHGIDLAAPRVAAKPIVRSRKAASTGVTPEVDACTT